MIQKNPFKKNHNLELKLITLFFFKLFVTPKESMLHAELVIVDSYTNELAVIFFSFKLSCSRKGVYNYLRPLIQYLTTYLFGHVAVSILVNVVAQVSKQFNQILNINI